MKSMEEEGYICRVYRKSMSGRYTDTKLILSVTVSPYDLVSLDGLVRPCRTRKRYT